MSERTHLREAVSSCIHRAATAIRNRQGRFIRGYGVAAVLVALAAGLRWALPGTLAQTPYLAFYPAVVAAAAFGGFGPGLAATLASFLVIDLVFDNTPGWVHWRDPVVLTRMIIFLAGGIGVGALAALQRRSRERERRQAADLARALAESARTAQRLRRLVEADLMGVLYWDMTGAVTGANDTFLRMIGYCHEELITGRIDWTHMTPPEYRPLDERALEQLRITGVDTPYEKELIRKDGARVWVLIGAASLDDARREGIAFCLDITERKRAERKLRESEERFRALYEQAAVGIERLDLDGRLLEGNNKLVQILGYSSDELRHKTFFDITHPDDWAAEQKLLEQLLVGKIPNYTIEKRYVHKDGHPVWVRVTSSLVKGLTQSDTYRISMIEDVTERRQAQEALRQAKDELEVRVAERTVQLRAAVNELQRANDDLEQFTWISSHDLQEPLRMIGSYVGMLAYKYKDKLDEEANECIRYAEEGAVRMSHLIKAVMEYSRVNTVGRSPQPTGARAALEHALRNLEPVIRAGGARVTADDLPTVVADPVQLSLVFQHLIDNAIKFAREDRPARVHVAAELKDNQWVFSVRDNGIGIEPRHQEQIFVAFKRLSADRRRYPGAGIGLALIKRIVERHHGRVCVDSRPGEGATFYFTLPNHEAGKEEKDYEFITVGGNSAD